MPAKLMRGVVVYSGTAFGLFLVFFFLVVAVHFIPKGAIKKNIGRSLETLKKEGTYPMFGVLGRQIVLDNYTDALMLNTAYSAESKTPVRASLLNYRHDSTIQSANQIMGLEGLYKNEKSVKKVGYERYWHGYLVYLRPLLMVFSYSQIRVILTLVLMSMYLGLIVLAYKKVGLHFSVALTAGLLAVDFFYLGQSLQFAGVFLVGLSGSLYLLANAKKVKKGKLNLSLVFLVVGALTSYIDLLTAPIVSLGMLLIMAINLRKARLFEVISYCFFWSLGYLLLWFGKWALVGVLFAPGAISTGFSQVLNRTVTQADANFSHLRALQLNLFQLIGYAKISKIVVLASASLYFLFFLKYFTFSVTRLKKALFWLGLAVLPYLWYLVAANHSYLHVWYAYRSQFMSVACLLLASFQFLKLGKYKQV
jgi:hypothetical protein